MFFRQLCDRESSTCTSLLAQRPGGAALLKHVPRHPRLQVCSPDAYAALMNGPELADPGPMDIAAPANRACGERRPG